MGLIHDDHVIGKEPAQNVVLRFAPEFRIHEPGPDFRLQGAHDPVGEGLVAGDRVALPLVLIDLILHLAHVIRLEQIKAFKIRGARALFGGPLARRFIADPFNLTRIENGLLKIILERMRRQHDDLHMRRLFKILLRNSDSGAGLANTDTME